MTIGMYMYMPAADCPKALKLTFFVALFSQSTLATVTGWLRMIWELFLLGGGVGMGRQWVMRNGKDCGA